ncbi:MAG: nicotinamidase [Verrucomicrobiales bacterium]|nr:nicotinamidase [Verrucomicrobiales bacterium]|tara:strand:+ start:12755 stop:14317 length:1563 start_codon:yes stop_codon:yes gene_type:complete
MKFHTLLTFAFIVSSLSAETLNLNFRSQKETAENSGKYHSITKAGKWDAKKTAIVVCDMWNDHYCRNAARRVGEMAPRMNEVLKAARKRGVLIIHCPSGCMKHYADTPQRKFAQQAPKVEAKIKLESWCYLDPKSEAPMPVKVDQPCDDAGKLREAVRFFDRQIKTLEIKKGDAITDSAEAYYLMEQRGIENVIIMGVHVNMCVLGRPFGIRQMVRAGQNVALMRDMTDAMYNPAEEPFVNHFTGNDLIFEHIERYWCPTITSGDILRDGKTYRFPGDKRQHVVIVMGEREYKTAETLPAFAMEELARDFKISLVYADAEDRNNLPGAEVIKQADVVVLSLRRRNLPKSQLDLFRKHIASGKALVGIRTASHPFHQSRKAAPKGLDEWRDFDPSVLGGNYHGHMSAKLTTFARSEPKNAEHPILNGIGTRQFQTFGSLYEVSPLKKSTTVLMTGHSRGDSGREPVAWTNEGPGGGKVFYTSLGHPYDFGVTSFRKLLRNAVYWAVDAEPSEKATGSSCCE